MEKNNDKNIDKNSVNDILHISKKILKIFYLLIIVVGAYLLLRICIDLKVFSVIGTIFKILMPLFLGVVVAWLLNPFVKWLESKRVRRSIGVFAAYVIFVGCLILLIQAIIPLIYKQTIELVDNIPNIFSDLKKWAVDLLGNIDNSSVNVQGIKDNFFSKLDLLSVELTTSLPSTVINGATSLISSIGTFVIGLVIGFFLLLGVNNLGNTLIELIPTKFRDNVCALGRKINQSLRNYVNGALIDAFVVFAVSSIAFALIGLKAPLLFGLFCGLMNIIPYAGPYIGGAPAVIVGFSQGTGVGIAVLIAIIIIQSIEGNILQTLIISKTTKLHPVTIIIGLLVFGHFFGIIGMLLSTPIIGVLKVIIKHFDEKYHFFNFSKE